MKKLVSKQTYIKIKQYLFLTFGVFLMAVAFYFFVIPSGIVVGGTTGISMVIYRYTQVLPISMLALILNGILLIAAFLFIGKKEFVRSLYGSILFPIFLAIFEIAIPSPTFRDTDLLLVALYAGGLIGIGFAIVIHNGGTTGGTDIIIQIVQKYTRLTIGTAVYVVESTVILLGVITSPNGIESGLITLLYAVAITFLSGKVSDSFLLGIEQKKALNIVTTKPQELKKAVFASFSRGMTEIPSIGGYSETSRTILVMVIHNSEYHFVKRIIQDTDPSAFVYVTPASEIQGEWSSPDEVILEDVQSTRTKKAKK
ncbi:MAG: YitT family protein [Candidatus Izemoplasmatales bacterium]